MPLTPGTPPAPERGEAARSGKGAVAPVASAKHSWILIIVMLALAVGGFLALQRTGPASHSRSGAGGGASLYLGLLVSEWALFAYVRFGLRRYGTSLKSLISSRALTARSAIIDVLLGLALLVVLVGTERALAGLFGEGNQNLVQALLVRRLSMIPLWIAVALSAGFVEEVVFRGYFQRQFGAWTGSTWLGVILQAILFAVTHGYQGWVLVANIAVLGLLFGVTALLRRSLVPGMVAHAGLDILSGLVAFR